MHFFLLILRILASINTLASNVIIQSNSSGIANTSLSMTFPRQTFTIYVYEPPVPLQNATPPSLTISAVYGEDVNSISDLTNGFLSDTMQTDSSASVFLNTEFFEELRNTTILNDTNTRTRIITVLYLLDSPFFPSVRKSQNQGGGNESELFRRGSVVFTVARAENQGPPPSDLDPPIRFTFQSSTVSFKEVNILCLNCYRMH